jgi:hypothetical protein
MGAEAGTDGKHADPVMAAPSIERRHMNKDQNTIDALRVILHRAEQARHSSEKLGPIAAEWIDGIITESREALDKLANAEAGK